MGKHPRSIPTTWHGIDFRSRTEARWAVYFECLCIDWEYEPQGFELGSGAWYLPDFILHGMCGRCGEWECDLPVKSTDHDMFVEVKGRWRDDDMEKVRELANSCPVYVVGEMRRVGRSWYRNMEFVADNDYMSVMHNFTMVDGDQFGAYIGINDDGYPELFGADSTYLQHAWHEVCDMAFDIAVKPRFDHGDMPDEARVRECKELVTNRRRECMEDFDVWIHDNDDHDAEPLPDGSYRFTVTDFKKDRVREGRRNAGANMAVYTMLVDGDGRQVRLKYFIPLVDSLRWKAMQFFKCIGAISADTKEDERIRLPWKGVIGRTGICQVEVSSWTDQYGRYRVGNRIDSMVVAPCYPSPTLTTVPASYAKHGMQSTAAYAKPAQTSLYGDVPY